MSIILDSDFVVESGVSLSINGQSTKAKLNKGTYTITA